MEQIPLHEAMLCVNCNTITRRPKQYCPHCAGGHLVPISVWLNPRPVESAGSMRRDAAPIVRAPAESRQP
jgi:hypothetical protein